MHEDLMVFVSLKYLNFWPRSNALHISHILRWRSDDAEIQAIVDKENFITARETVLSIKLQHPITYDQYNICAMAKEAYPEQLKLGTLKNTCQQVELEVPPKPVRRNVLYVDLL